MGEGTADVLVSYRNPEGYGRSIVQHRFETALSRRALRRLARVGRHAAVAERIEVYGIPDGYGRSDRSIAECRSRQRAIRLQLIW